MQPPLEQRTVSASVKGVELLDIAAMYRAGGLTPIVFLHAFGSTKEDYADIVHYSAFNGHPSRSPLQT